MMIPALVIALQDASKEVRMTGVAVLKAVAANVGKKEGEVYAVDTFYGSQSSESFPEMRERPKADLPEMVQLLKPAYLEKYLQALKSAASNIVLDPAHVATIHATVFGPHGAHSKKDKGVNRAILASLFSHVGAWRSLGPRLVLLRSFTGLHDQAVLRGVLPLLMPLVDGKSEESLWLAEQAESERGLYLELLVGTLEKQSVVLLAVPDSESWKFVEGLLSAEAETRKLELPLLTVLS
jgi:U3 small nucleolar RNA-associated protein 10